MQNYMPNVVIWCTCMNTGCHGSCKPKVRQLGGPETAEPEDLQLCPLAGDIITVLANIN